MSPSLKARAHKSLRFSPSEVEAAVSRNNLILPNSAISMKFQNATRVAGAGDGMSLEGEAVVVFVTNGAVVLSTCASGDAAGFALGFLGLLPGAMDQPSFGRPCPYPGRLAVLRTGCWN